MNSIPAKKSLGQNFLKDESVLQKIAHSIIVKPNDLILEIGPGKGALTKYLIQKDCHYCAYEIDQRMKSVLSSLSDQIIYDDFLCRNLAVDLDNYCYDQLFVIANIPYYITTPIIEHLLKYDINIQEMTLLVQKEVADRFCAKPCTRDYGFFTVYLNYYFEVSKLFGVSRNCFDPVPNVDSAVVHFKKKALIELDEKKYFDFLKICFRNKRKTLKNNLKGYNWENIMKILIKYNYNDSVRAEELSSEVFVDLFLNH